MNFDEIKFTKQPKVSISTQEITDLEDNLWITFPKGYREYITNLGEGSLAHTIRVYPPDRIKRDLAQWRQRIKNYWFWDNEPQLLPKERALESIILGDTLYGDELVFHPSRPDKIFLLPHESENAQLLGNNLIKIVEDIISQIKEEEEEDFELTFEPFDSRNASKDLVDIEDVQDPDGESIEDLIKLTPNWEIRHSARKQANERLKKQMTSDMKSKIINEGICIKTDKGDIGYFIEFLISDIASGDKVGIFKFHKNSQSWGTDWKPNSAHYPL